MTQIQKFVFPLTNQETRIVDLDGNPCLQTKPDGQEVVRARAKITAKGLAKLASAFEAVPSN